MRTHFLIGLLFIFSESKSQTTWMAVHSYGEVSFHENTNSLCTDADGFSYITGSFQDSIIFGNDTLTNPGGGIFLAKFDSMASPVWAMRFGGDNSLEITSSALDDSGYIYLAGALGGTAIFGNDTVSNQDNHKNLFLGKFDSNGNLIWSQQATGGMGNTANSVAVYESKVFITGTYDTSVTIGTTFLPGGPGNNIFVAQYDNNGNNIWARASSSSTTVVVNGIACDQSGNACITGYFRNSLTFGNITITAPSNGGASVFLVQYDSLGNAVWAKNSGGFPSSGYARSIASDSAGDYYCAGYFDSPVMIFGTDTLINAGNNDIFISKYDNSGNLLWSKRAGGNDYDEANAVTVDKAGNAYMTGFFRGFISFGNTFLSGPFQELYVVKYDLLGNIVWATSATGSINERGYGIGIGQHNNIYVSGDFTSPTTTFGTLSITNTDQFTGSYDIFFARLGESTTDISEPLSSQNHLQIFPNPSTGNFKIMNAFSEKSILRVYSIEGRLLNEMILKSRTISLDIKPGIYLLQLQTDDSLYNCRIEIY